MVFKKELVKKESTINKSSGGSSSGDVVNLCSSQEQTSENSQPNSQEPAA